MDTDGNHMLPMNLLWTVLKHGLFATSGHLQTWTPTQYKDAILPV